MRDERRRTRVAEHLRALRAGTLPNRRDIARFSGIPPSDMPRISYSLRRNLHDLSVRARRPVESSKRGAVRPATGAGAVLREGRPVVVHNLRAAGIEPAPAERNYKTESFISYPISVSGRKVGVLNVTDKAGGGAYDEFDLTLLEMIAPQMALALDRTEWHLKATQFQLLRSPTVNGFAEPALPRRTARGGIRKIKTASLPKCVS